MKDFVGIVKGWKVYYLGLKDIRDEDGHLFRAYVYGCERGDHKSTCAVDKALADVWSGEGDVHAYAFIELYMTLPEDYMFDKLKKAGKAVAEGVGNAVEEVRDNECSWEIEDREDGLVSVITECDKAFEVDDHYVQEYKFCPLCGKKIKR